MGLFSYQHTMRIRVSHPWVLAVCARAIAAYGRLVFATARVRYLGAPPAELTQGAVLLALWHQNMFAVPLLAAPNAPRPLVGLMSASTDGRLTQAIARHYGIGAAVGSSSKQAVPAARSLIRMARAGNSLFLTPDGPRGPLHQAKEGASELARLTGLPLIPCAASAHPSWAVRSWDNFRLPLPFATFTVVWGAALSQPTPQSLTQTLNTLQEQAETGAVPLGRGRRAR